MGEVFAQEEYPANYNAFRRVLAAKIKGKWQELQSAPQPSREVALEQMNGFAAQLSLESGASPRLIRELMSSMGIEEESW